MLDSLPFNLKPEYQSYKQLTSLIIQTFLK